MAGSDVVGVNLSEFCKTSAKCVCAFNHPFETEPEGASSKIVPRHFTIGTTYSHSSVAVRSARAKLSSQDAEAEIS